MLPFLPLLPIFLPDLCFPPLPPQLYELDSFCVDPRRIQEGRKPPVLLHVLSCCQPSPSPLSGTAAHCSALPSWNCCTVCTLKPCNCYTLLPHTAVHCHPGALAQCAHCGTAAHWHRSGRPCSDATHCTARAPTAGCYGEGGGGLQ